MLFIFIPISIPVNEIFDGSRYNICSDIDLFLDSVEQLQRYDGSMVFPDHKLKKVKPPFLLCRIPGHFKRYSGCRGLVRRMPTLKQTRFGCHELKSKNYFRTKTVEIHQIIF